MVWREIVPSVDPKLIDKYNQVYMEGEQNFFTFDSYEEQRFFLENIDFKDRIVMEIGCGTGDMAIKIAMQGAKHVYGIDASSEAIYHAKRKIPPDLSNISFQNDDFMQINPEKPYYDVVIMIGVLEHLENPEKAITHILQNLLLKKDGVFCTSSPFFYNPRGIVWATLQLLFDFPMSLTDKWMISPQSMVWYANKLGWSVIDWTTVDRSWSCADGMIKDFKKRLPAVMPFVKKEKIEALLQWLQAGKNFIQRCPYGANACYIIKAN